MNLTRLSTRSPSDRRGLLYANFNQDHGYFAIGLDNGFRVFNCDPPKEKARGEFENGGIGIIEMLYRTNYVALTGGGRNPNFPPNKVFIWDLHAKVLSTQLEFYSEVKSIKLRRDRIIVVLSNKVSVYSFSMNPKKLKDFETTDNEKGLVAVSTSDKEAFVAFPGLEPGHIQIVNLNSYIATMLAPTSPVDTTASGQSTDAHNTSSDGSKLHSGKTNAEASHSQDTLHSKDASHSKGASHSKDTPSSSKTTPSSSKATPSSSKTTSDHLTTSATFISAHTAPLSCLAMDANGLMVASASENGTLIRVFEVQTGKLMHELRRGADRAEIYSIAFSIDSTRVCVSSDKGTIHIFNLDLSKLTEKKEDHSNGEAGNDKEAGHGGETGNNGEAAVQQINSESLNKPVGPHPSVSSGNRHSTLSFMRDLLPKYFSSEWSFAHCRLSAESRCICTFGPDRNSIIVICADGSCYKFTFDPVKGGECIRESHNRFLRFGEDDEGDD